MKYLKLFLLFVGTPIICAYVFGWGVITFAVDQYYDLKELVQLRLR